MTNSSSSSSSSSNNNNNNNNRTSSVTPQRNLLRICGITCSSCGYCHGSRRLASTTSSSTGTAATAGIGTESSTSYGLLFQDLTPWTYERLICRGWRRSGLHVYLPKNELSCCPALAIRLPVESFAPTKSQRRVLHRMERLMAVGQTQHTRTSNNSPKRKPTTTTTSNNNTMIQQLEQWTTQALAKTLSSTTISFDGKVTYKIQSSKMTTNATTITFVTKVCAAIAGPSKGNIQKDVLAEQVVNFLKEHHCDDGRIINMMVHESSGQILITTRKQTNPVNFLDKQQSMETDEETRHGLSTNLQMWFHTQPPPQPPYQMQITTMSATDSALCPDVHRLYFDYQHDIHGDVHPLKCQLTEEQHVHEDENDMEDWGDATIEFQNKALEMLKQQQYPADRWRWIKSMYIGFYRFLVESPLISTSLAKEGTFHQHYRIADQLVAVGVVDVLPNGVSSVYAFYDAQFSHTIVAMGKYAILKEIDFTLALNKPYYYLGYYIESCPKMRYKMEYHPSELLCPTHYQWVDGKAGQSILRQMPNHYGTLYMGPSPISQETDEEEEEVINKIRLSVPSLLTLSMLQPQGQAIVQPHLEEFLHHVGPKIAKECIINLA